MEPIAVTARRCTIRTQLGECSFEDVRVTLIHDDTLIIRRDGDDIAWFSAPWHVLFE